MLPLQLRVKHAEHAALASKILQQLSKRLAAASTHAGLHAGVLSSRAGELTPPRKAMASSQGAPGAEPGRADRARGIKGVWGRCRRWTSGLPML